MRLTKEKKLGKDIKHKYRIDRSSEIEKNWDEKDLTKKVLKIKEYNINEIVVTIELGTMLGSSSKTVSSEDELLQILNQKTISEIRCIHFGGEYKGTYMGITVDYWFSSIILFSESEQNNKEIAALVEKV